MGAPTATAPKKNAAEIENIEVESRKKMRIEKEQTENEGEIEGENSETVSMVKF